MFSIRYVAACQDVSGYAKASRGYIGALLDTKEVDLSIECVSFETSKTTHGVLGEEIKKYIGRQNNPRLQIVHLTPDNFTRFVKPGMYNIGYSAWETDKLPEHWANYCNLMDEMWVPSGYNVEVFRNSGVTKPIRKILHGIELPDLTGITPMQIGDPDTYVFYFIGQFLERKSPLTVLKAYLSEFQNDENVQLAFKTYRLDTSTKEQEIIKQTVKAVKNGLNLPHYPPITFYGNLLPAEYMHAMHMRGDCFILPARSEGFGLCVTPETLVCTTTGDVVTMRDVNVGDYVLASDGKCHSVKHKFSRYSPTLSIRATACPKLDVTPEHPFLCLKKRTRNTISYYTQHLTLPVWHEASELEVGDLVAIVRPELPSKLPSEIDISEFIDFSATTFDVNATTITSPRAYSSFGNGTTISIIQDTYQVSKHCAERARRMVINGDCVPNSSAGNLARKLIADKVMFNTPKVYSRYVEVDSSFMQFLGWYLAEGSSTEGAIEIDLHAREIDIAQNLTDYLREVFNAKTSIMIEGNHCRVTASSFVLARLVDTLCGHGAHNKAIHECFISSSRLVGQMIKCLFLGDGHLGKDGWRLSTTSQRLAWQVRHILLSVGILPGISKQRDDWIVSISGDELEPFCEFTGLSHHVTRQSLRRHRKSLKQGQYIFVAISDITPNSLEQMVMDIEVDEVHSFVGNGLLLHNCHAEALAHGKPVISTRFGGALEFLDDSNSYLVGYVPTPVYGMLFSNYNASMTWAEPNIMEIKQAMRHAYEHRDEARAKGLKGKQDVTEKLNWKRIGQSMIKRIKEVYPK